MHLSPLHYELSATIADARSPLRSRANRVVTQPLAHQLVWSRVRKAATALGVCLAAATGLTVAGAQASPHPHAPAPASQQRANP